MRKVTLVLLILLLLVPFTLFSGGQFEREEQRINLSSGPMGGPWYTTAAKFAEWINQDTDLEVTTVEGRGLANVRMMETGRDAQLGMCYSTTWGGARKGTITDEQLVNARGLFATLASLVRIVVPADSDIYSIEDLKDKRIAPGPFGGDAEIVVRKLLELYGITYDDIEENGGEVQHVTYAEVGSLLKDGHIDALQLAGHWRHSVALDLDASGIELRVLEPDEEKLDEIQKVLPGLYVDEVDPGMYANTGPVKVLKVPGVYIVNKDLSEDVVEKITRVWFERASDAKEAFADRADIWASEDCDEWKQGIPEDLMHPGALKVYEEYNCGY